MTSSGDQDLSAFSMLDLFRQEAAAQVEKLNHGLLSIERNPSDKGPYEALMRAAHSIKGAARIVGIDAGVEIAHALEDCFVAAQKESITIRPESVDTLLAAVDMLLQMASASEEELTAWKNAHGESMTALPAALAAITRGEISAEVKAPALGVPTDLGDSAPAERPNDAAPPVSHEDTRFVRVSSDNLDRMLGMIGDCLVQTRWFESFETRLITLKRRQVELTQLLEPLSEQLRGLSSDEHFNGRLAEVMRKADVCRHMLQECMEEFDAYAGRTTELTDRLYRESLSNRMRPFLDIAQIFPRMVRDVARQLGKSVLFEIAGESTKVDRDILDRLEAPLAHLLRNAIAHGIEAPEERLRRGKEDTGVIRLQAWHQAGLLYISVSDDGGGIDLARLRAKVVERGYCTESMAASMSEREILDFIFLPGFSTAAEVTEISGRGVGLDIVQALVQDLGGSMKVDNREGAGMAFHLRLPVTLSVARCLLVEIAGEPFAMPLTRIDRIVSVEPEKLQWIEGRGYITVEGRNIGLIAGCEVLELAGESAPRTQWPVVVIGGGETAYGFLVDRFLGEQKLVVRPLDKRLGKIRDVSAISLMTDGAPVVVLDIEDLVRSIERLLHEGALRRIANTAGSGEAVAIRRILVADDSITVRELERRLLENKGYQVDVAVDGMDAWNRLQDTAYDLLVSDVDMPRMDGIQLVKNIRRIGRFQQLPIALVSYKDSQSDRMRGMEAGANYYLTKGSFHDDTFIRAVVSLIGEPCE